jgi:uncharacterized iron-regulated protein
MAKILRSLLILTGALLSSCVSQPRSTNTLSEANGRYLLDRAFQDFYDTAFVLTNDGKTAPRVVSLPQVAAALLQFDVVFYGESHSHAGVHLQQMELLRALYARDSRWVVSFEQFERDVQGIVDDYLARRIGETALIDKGRAWNNYATSYRPLLIFAKDHHLPVIAAEAPGWAVTCVGQWGTGILDRFTPLERSWVAKDLHVVPGAYRDKFMNFLGSSAAHGGGTPATPETAAKAERSFSAQITRDDTMAESIERAIQEHPGHKVLHLTGSFHSAGFLGTVERLRMRDPTLKIAVIEPVEVADARAPAFAADSLGEGTVLQLIYPLPDAFADGEDMSASIAKVAHERETNRCKYAPTPSPSPTPAPSHPTTPSQPTPVPKPTPTPTPTKPPRSQSAVAANDSGRLWPPSMTRLWSVM